MVRKVLVDAPCSGDGTLRKSCAGWVHWRAGEGKALHKLQLGRGVWRDFYCYGI
jgi:16S rRNA C967 or C1407 C5-methylase (RsmB/RsmF family)